MHVSGQGITSDFINILFSIMLFVQAKGGGELNLVSCRGQPEFSCQLNIPALILLNSPCLICFCAVVSYQATNHTILSRSVFFQ